MADYTLYEVALAGIVVLITAVTNVLRQMEKGTTAKATWIILELLSAILAGLLMYDAYPKASMHPLWPAWFTMPISVAVAAYSGTRVLQVLEDKISGSWFMFTKK